MKTFPRLLSVDIKKDLEKKLVLLAGPRQCGKTTFAKTLFAHFDYLNFDNFDDKQIILKQMWNRKKDFIILDEIHKMPRWKSFLKGIYDNEGVNPKMLVTGSAQFDTFRKFGDSLAGRHFYYRLHPLDIKELVTLGFKDSPQNILERLIKVSSFPDPFFNGEIEYYRKWRQTHLDVIIKQDLIDLEAVKDIQSVSLLVQMLRSKVGSALSINSLATVLHKDPKTIQRWLNLLEELFVIFKVTPFSKNIARSVKKEPKYYFYDTAFVEGSYSQKIENVVACALLKEAHFQTDAKGNPYKLYFLKVKGGREIDFFLHAEDADSKSFSIEVKESDQDPSANFKLFKGVVKNNQQIQLVANIKKDLTTAAGLEVRNLADWLTEINLK